MIIRSQDKTMIVNLNNIDCICYSDRENEIIVFNGEAQSHIGIYSTEEKAIKVLDMITEHYDEVMDARYWNDTYQNNCFQMPQDSEV